MRKAPDAAQFCDNLEFNRFHALLTFLGMATLIFDGYDSQIISYILPNMIKEWNLSPVEAGSITSYGLVGLMIGTAGLSMLADRIGRKIPLLLGLFLFSFFGGALYWAPDFKSFCVLRFCSGLGIGGVLALTVTLATEFAPARIRAAMVTAMVTGFMIGPALAGWISMIFVPLYGWRSVLLFGCLPLLFLPVLYLLMPESIRFLTQKGRFEEATAILRRMERSGRLAPADWTKESFSVSVTRSATLRQLFSAKLRITTILIWMVYFFNLLALYGLTTWLPTLLVASGVSLVRSYGYASFNHVGGAIGTLLVGVLMDRFGRKPGLIFAYLSAAVAVFIFGYLTGSPIALYVIGAATGFFVTGAQSAHHAATAEIYPTLVRSTGVGAALTMGRFGAVCGPLLGGLLQSEHISFNGYFAVFSIPCLFCAALVFFYRVNVRGEALETVEQEVSTPAATVSGSGSVSVSKL